MSNALVSIWIRDKGKVRTRKAVDTATKVTVTDAAFCLRSLILSVWPAPRLTSASRTETFSFHTSTLLLTERHSQGKKEKMIMSTQLHILKRGPYSSSRTHCLRPLMNSIWTPYRRCVCMAAMKRDNDNTMTLDFRTVHRTLARCGHRTHTALWTVIATSVQADRTPET